MRLVKMLLLLTILSLGLVSAASYLRPSTAASSGKYFDYVVTILMENNDLPSVLSQGAFQASLANQHTLSTGYSGVTHPSEPNYAALIGGHIGPSPDDGICCGQDSSTNAVDRLESQALTWKAYAEGLANGDCSGGGIDTDHFPFLFFSDITNNPSRCANLLGATAGTDTQLITALNAPSGWANYIWLTPNTSNDAHDTSIAFGDSYLSGLVPQILGSNLFRSQRAALFIVYDEGNDVSCSSGGSDCIYASWSGPVTKKGFSSSNAYTHYSYLHTIEDNWGLPTLTSNDAGASVMSEFFASSGPTPLLTSFTISPSPAQAGQTVTFAASSSGGTLPYSDSWSFGDGSSGSGPTVTHSYSGTGTFQVALTTRDSASPVNTVTSTKSINVNQAPLPGSLSISFTLSPSSPSTGQVVTFTADVSGGTPPFGVGWDFGDGGISVGLSTTHTFSSLGTFNVTAAVTDSGSPTSFAVTSRFVTIGSGPSPPASLSADFSFQPTNPSVGDTVSFTPTVSGGTGPYGYNWGFGDSVGSDTAANPSYSYSSSGTFSVTLTVTDSVGNSVLVSNNVVVASGTPTPPPPSNGSSGQYCSALASGPGGDLEPLVPVDYVNPSNSAQFATSALFDTGSVYSLAPSSLAASLGLTLSEGTPVTLTSVSGSSIQARVFHLTLSFGGTLQVVNVPVAFTDSTDQFLIGRLGFLNQVSVTFDSSGQMICFDAGSPSSSDSDGSGEGAGSCDGDGDEDDVGCDEGEDSGSSCGDGDGDEDDVGCGDSGDSSFGEDFFGLASFASGGAMSGLPVMLTLIPIVALGAAISIQIVKAPRVFRARRRGR